MSKQWWKTAVIYQVYLRSFCDGSGDGMGDIAGIRSRLPWLRDLGVDALWINPWYPSPMADAGYDVADYRDIDPMFGTLADAEQLIADAHELGLRVLLDIVPNHTSEDHVWFRAALQAEPGSVVRERYWFRPGRGAGGELPPNDWRSVFGGPAWTRTTTSAGEPGEWYLHLFSPEQPDLNWEHPEVRAEFESVLRFWFDRGVDGFRIDVAHGLVKDPSLPDLGIEEDRILAPSFLDEHPHWDHDDVHDVFRQWRRVADEYEPPRVFVAEAWVQNADRLARYLRSDELHTAFNFDYLRAPWRADALRDVIVDSMRAADSVGAPPTWVLSNHDVVRHVSRFARAQVDGAGHSLVDVQESGAADLQLGRRRARAAALLMLALPGSAYVYQGEELGLEEVEDLPEDVLQDPTWIRSGRLVRGRDGCRVPLPWSGARAPFGFSTDPAATPWLPQPEAWADRTAAAQADDPTSMLELYRTALGVRRERFVPATSIITWLDSPSGVLAFQRGDTACIVNFGTRPFELPTAMQVLLRSDAPVPGASGEVASTPLEPDSAAWLHVAE